MNIRLTKYIHRFDMKCVMLYRHLHLTHYLTTFAEKIGNTFTCTFHIQDHIQDLKKIYFTILVRNDREKSIVPIFILELNSSHNHSHNAVLATTSAPSQLLFDKDPRSRERPNSSNQ